MAQAPAPPVSAGAVPLEKIDSLYANGSAPHRGRTHNHRSHHITHTHSVHSSTDKRATYAANLRESVGRWPRLNHDQVCTLP